MKTLTDFINEELALSIEAIEEAAEVQIVESETINDEKSFRAAAEAKFKDVFGDDLDEKQMNDTIDGILSDNKELVDAGDWGALIGLLNKSFTS